MSFLAGIQIVCFAASYAVAWLLELARLLVARSRIPVAMSLFFATVGLVAQTLYLGRRGLDAQGAPLSSSFDWCLVGAWLIVVACIYLTVQHPGMAAGLFLLPLSLLLIAAATFLASREPLVSESATRIWGAIHGGFLSLGTVAVLIGFAAGVAYLLQADRLKRKKPPLTAFRLPSLEWLERVNSRALMLSAVLVALGFVAGAVLKIGDRPASFPWSDPIIWSSGVMLGWLIVAALFNVFYKPARHGRKVAYLTIASFVFLLIVLGVLLLVDTSHGKKRNETARLAPLPRIAQVRDGGAS